MRSLLIVFCLGAILSSCTYQRPVTATSNSVGYKVGTSTGGNWLGIFNTGDASFRQAAKNGNIKDISTVDKRKTFFLIYTRTSTVVTGN